MVMSSCIGAIVYILLLSSILYSGQPQLFVEGSKWHPQHSAQESNVHGRSAEISTDTVPHAVNNRVTKVKSVKGGPPPKTKVKKFKGKGKGSISKSKSKSKGGSRNDCSPRVYKPPPGCSFTCVNFDTAATTAINSALNSANPSYIGCICPGQYSLPATNVLVNNPNLNAKASLTLSCCGPSGSCIIGGNTPTPITSSLFAFQTPAIVSFAGLTFQNIAGTGIKGALLHTNVAADVKLNFLTVQSVSVNTNFSGGAIYFNSGTIANIKNSIFTGNSAGLYGGAIYSDQSRVYLTNNKFATNSAAAQGGAVEAFSSSVIATCNIFFSNSAVTYGGAIYINQSSMDSMKNTYDSNKVTTGPGGGAVDTIATTITVNGDLFKLNTSPTTSASNINLDTSTMFYCNVDITSLPTGVFVDSGSLSLKKCITN